MQLRRGYYGRFRRWLATGDAITEREFYLALTFLFLLVTILLVFAGVSYRNNSARVADNRNRINDIKRDENEIRDLLRATQASRIRSCKTTYESFPAVIRSLLPKKPSTWTKQERLSFLRFKHVADKLAAQRCVHQTSVHTQDGKPTSGRGDP